MPAFLGRPDFARPRGQAEGPLRAQPHAWAAGPASPEQQLERLRARFGPGRVVRLRLPGTADADVRSSLSRRFESLRDPGSEWAMSTSSSLDQINVILAPVIDLDSLTAKIDFGRVLDIDRPERVITVAVDRLRLPKH